MVTQIGSERERGATAIVGGLPPIVGLRIEQTPHTSLRPNDRTHERTKAKHRKVLKEAAKLAMHNVLIRMPHIEEAFSTGALRLSYSICWEQGRKRLDGDSALIVLKGATDGIAQKLGRNDRDFVFAPVEQSFIGTRQGITFVMIERVETSPPATTGRSEEGTGCEH